MLMKTKWLKKCLQKLKEKNQRTNYLCVMTDCGLFLLAFCFAAFLCLQHYLSISASKFAVSCSGEM